MFAHDAVQKMPGSLYAVGVGSAAGVSYVVDHSAVYTDVLRMLASLPS